MRTITRFLPMLLVLAGIMLVSPDAYAQCGAGGHLVYNGITGKLDCTGNSGVGTGTVTNVGLSVPSWLTVAGSPVTTTGTFAVTPTAAQTSHQVIGTCNTATTFGPCSLVAGDLPAIPISTGVSGLGTGVATALGLAVSGSGSICLTTGSSCGAVSSVFTRTGAVVAASGDYTAAQVTNAVDKTAANTYSGGGLQDMSAVDLLSPTHASDPATCTAGQFEFNTAGSFKGCTATNTWTTFSTGAATTFEVGGTGGVSSATLNILNGTGMNNSIANIGGVATVTNAIDPAVVTENVAFQNLTPITWIPGSNTTSGTCAMSGGTGPSPTPAGYVDGSGRPLWIALKASATMGACTSMSMNFGLGPLQMYVGPDSSPVVPPSGTIQSGFGTLWEYVASLNGGLGGWILRSISGLGPGAGGGMSIGGTVTSGTAGDYLYVGAGPVLAQASIAANAVPKGSASTGFTASSVTDNGTTVTTSEPLFTSYAGTASQSSLYATGAPYTAGTATTNFPLLYLNDGTGPTSFSTAGTEFGINAPSGFTGNMMDFHVNGGASVAKLDASGNLTVTSCTGCGGLSIGATVGGSPTANATLYVDGSSTLQQTAGTFTHPAANKNQWIFPAGSAAASTDGITVWKDASGNIIGQWNTGSGGIGELLVTSGIEWTGGANYSLTFSGLTGNQSFGVGWSHTASQANGADARLFSYNTNELGLDTGTTNTFASMISHAREFGMTNAGTTGTTQFLLAKLTGAPSTAVNAATTDTAGIIGVTQFGAGTSGTAHIADGGKATCTFDGATTAGDYVQISATVAGNCHDAGATRPATGEILGFVLSTNGAGGNYVMLLALQNE